MGNILYENGHPIYAIVDGKMVEVQEVKHGRWIEADDDGVMDKCSVCGELSCCRSPYCGECGAKMDDDTEKVLGELSKVFAKTLVNKDDNYCTEENCEIYDNDLSCERCNK